jgi:hypothetical protein
MRAVEPPYTLLYGGLELDDGAQIVSRLEAMHVPFRLQGDGSAILMPGDQALRLRMTLAEDNLPRGGTVGNEIFDQTSALGTTERMVTGRAGASRELAMAAARALVARALDQQPLADVEAMFRDLVVRLEGMPWLELPLAADLLPAAQVAFARAADEADYRGEL